MKKIIVKELSWTPVNVFEMTQYPESGVYQVGTQLVMVNKLRMVTAVIPVDGMPLVEIAEGGPGGLSVDEVVTLANLFTKMVTDRKTRRSLPPQADQEYRG